MDELNLLSQEIDLQNPEFRLVWQLIAGTNRSVFLTGKAGTGKSTFLRYICAHTKKKYVVLAPTGVAAVNVGGQTLHSFFKIPFKPLLPDDPDYSPKRMKQTLRFPKDKVKLLQELELIIIDEISMVRADIIDHVDRVLRCYTGRWREPFGGKQLLFVGDVFQLPPVVKSDERQILSMHYHNFFFFNAHVFEKLGLLPVELRKVYRQEDPQFVALLDRVRSGHALDADLLLLNGRLAPDGGNEDGDAMVMTLATRRDTVSAINEQHMAAISEPEMHYIGEVEGIFDERSLPTDVDLTLKVGAQVLFIRNDRERRWVNGTVGRVSAMGDDFVWVELEDGEEYQVKADVWENIQYSYNKEKQQVEEKVLGTFKQLPLKAAWALTVHKSQGKTFSRVAIDFEGGAFECGQAYVALSRCRSLEGITLCRRLSQRDVRVSGEVLSFARSFNDRAAIDDAVRNHRANDLYARSAAALDAGDLRQALELFADGMRYRDELQRPAVRRLIISKLGRLARLQQIIDEQKAVIDGMAAEYASLGFQSLELGGLPAGVGNVPLARGADIDKVAVRSAMANFDKALRLDANCHRAMLGKARVLMLLDDREKATELLERATKLSPNDFEVLMTLGDVMLAGDETAAAKVYRRAARADKTRHEPWLRLADCYDSLGLEEDADECRDKARQLLQPKKRKK